MESDLSENSNAYNECNDILEVLLNKLKNNFKSFYTRSVVKFKKQYFELNDLFKNIKEIRETLINIEDNSYEFSNECPIEYLIDKYYKILIFSHQNNIDFPEIIYLISQNIRELNSSMKGEKFNLNVKDESLVKNYLNNLNQIRKKLNDVVFQFFSKDLNINGINESERTEFIIYYTYAMLSGINKTEKNDLKLYYLKLLTDFYIPETNLNLSEYAEIYFIKILNFVSPIVHKKGNSIFTHICDNLKSWKNLKNINSHNQLLSIFRIDVEEDKPTDFFYDLLKNVNLSIQKHYFDRNFKQKSRMHIPFIPPPHSTDSATLEK